MNEAPPKTMVATNGNLHAVSIRSVNDNVIGRMINHTTAVEIR